MEEDLQPLLQEEPQGIIHDGHSSTSSLQNHAETAYNKPTGVAAVPAQHIPRNVPYQVHTVRAVNSPSSSSSCIGPHPVHICCPNCHANIITNTRYVNGNAAWLLVIVLCLLGLFLVAWIPLLLNELKDVHHICPSCGHLYGVHERMFP
jgi:predicted RNA-binding Zn-ribbon protein involved in translation (DUF1610 family)